MSQFDLVLKGGTVIDGLQTPRYKADVGIRGGRVEQIGRISASESSHSSPEEREHVDL
jgi:N-acyl-D-aspartate/D-glutamate deacylase